jgi:hypothetical protein
LKNYGNPAGFLYFGSGQGQPPPQHHPQTMKILRFSLDLMKNEGKARHSQHHGVEIITPETLKQLILKTAVH